MKEDIVNDLIVEMAIPWNSTANVVEIHDILMEMDSPENHEWAVDDGVLFMDGVAFKRVGAKARPFFDDEESLYWEGRCLSMGEYVD